jgi:NADH:ubiquinone oxidoreductase subunit C
MTTLKSSFFQTYLSTNKNEFKKNQNPTFFFAQYLKLIFPDIQIFFEKEECFIKIPHKKINKVFVFLNKHSLSQSKALMEICAVDYPENIKRFDIYYNLLSLVFNNRLNVVISISVGTAVSSLTSLYKSAG